MSSLILSVLPGGFHYYCNDRRSMSDIVLEPGLQVDVDSLSSSGAQLVNPLHQETTKRSSPHFCLS